jgi:hypothetical protein
MQLISKLIKNKTQQIDLHNNKSEHNTQVKQKRFSPGRNVKKKTKSWKKWQEEDSNIHGEVMGKKQETTCGYL